MIKKLVTNLAKKYVLSALNDTLDAKKTDVDDALKIVAKWTDRLQRVLDCLKSISAKLEDGKVEESEAEAAVEEVQALVKEW